jgi:predicted RNA-binding Zn-ribbon protein involved in translation (DUF1610 family)
MKFDCPHCGQNLKSRQVEAGDIFGKSKGFACPHCGKPVKFQLHTEEFAAIALLSNSFVLLIQYLAGKPFWVILTAFALELVIVVAALAYLVRNKRRHEKLRSNI